ncbi:MAG: N-acetylneuraminate synthase family protein [Alphaproteobacteria bacterium]|jgi:N-acetylneuraminate synthase/N,N'-diacetyllegionaminate synthase|nr:N-acetylneuraminate synthase family protein [Alphaproteobacteria bacterium]|tara:strand:+ start:21529 stop:22638 length:1110 start_codon:yes stop_codon:yes gene_type:complete
MKSANVIQIGDRNLGVEEPIFIVAEIGINHNGDMTLAKEQIAAAAEAGADSVKFQNYHVNDFVRDPSLMFTYKSQGKEVTESQFDMFTRYQIGLDEMFVLKEYCDKCGIIFHSTPTSFAGIDDLIKVGAGMLKNGSDFLSHIELVEAMAKTGLPTVLSTGMANREDIEESVRYFRDAGNNDLIVLQCTSNYPTAPKDVHLLKMLEIAKEFDCLTGLSDHSQGSLAAVGAAMLGGVLIEKHFTSDHNLPGPDHWFSSDPDEFAALVKDVRAAEKSGGGLKAFSEISQEARDMLGHGSLELDMAEEESRKEYRLSCVAKYSLPKGHIIKKSDIDFQRPGYGFRPSYANHLVGRVLNKDIKLHHILQNEDFL